jgi:hypothetical protein
VPTYVLGPSTWQATWAYGDYTFDKNFVRLASSSSQTSPLHPTTPPPPLTLDSSLERTLHLFPGFSPLASHRGSQHVDAEARLRCTVDHCRETSQVLSDADPITAPPGAAFPFLCDADAATSPAGAASPIICLADPRMGGRMKKMWRFSAPDPAVLPTSGAGGMWGGHHVRLRPLGFCHLHMIFEMIFCSLSFMCVQPFHIYYP